MKEILFDFSRHNARGAQHLQFAADILEALPQNVLKSWGLEKQYKAFAAAVANEQEYFQPKKAYLETSEIEAVNLTRVRLFYFYRQTAQTYADYHPEEEKRDAGQTLSFAFREASRLRRSDYASKTALLTDLAAKLRQLPYSAALAVVGLQDAPDRLDAANEAFNAIYLKRSAAERERAQAWTMKQLRPVTDAAFNHLAQAINALYAANEMVGNDAEKRAVMEKVIDDVNAITVRLKKTIRKNSPQRTQSAPEEGTEENEKTTRTDEE